MWKATYINHTIQSFISLTWLKINASYILVTSCLSSPVSFLLHTKSCLSLPLVDIYRVLNYVSKKKLRINSFGITWRVEWILLHHETCLCVKHKFCTNNNWAVSCIHNSLVNGYFANYSIQFADDWIPVYESDCSAWQCRSLLMFNDVSMPGDIYSVTDCLSTLVHISSI
jgi:hypothetical protein